MQELTKNTNFLNAAAVNYLQDIDRFSVNPKLKQQTSFPQTSFTHTSVRRNFVQKSLNIILNRM